KIRCPACNTIFAPQDDVRPAAPIRRAEEAPYPAPRPAADVAAAPRRRLGEDTEAGYPPPPARPPAQGDPWGDDRPRRRPRQRPPWGLSIGGSAALVLLLGFVVPAFIWPGFLRSSTVDPGTVSANAQKLLNFIPPPAPLQAGGGFMPGIGGMPTGHMI